MYCRYKRYGITGRQSDYNGLAWGIKTHYYISQGYLITIVWT